MLSLFGETEARSESTPIKREPTPVPTTHKAKTGDLSLLGDAEVFSQRSESSPSETAAAPVPIPDTPVGNPDLASLDFLSQPLQYIKGIGPRRAEMISTELGIQTVGEFLAYYPRDYIDRSKTVEIYNVGRTEDDEPETIQGKLLTTLHRRLQREKRSVKSRFTTALGLRC